MTYNPILDTDSYKLSHYLQYPPGTTNVYSYVESRGGAFDRTVFFGLNLFLKRYLTKPVARENIDEAEGFAKAHGEPFNRAGFELMLSEHNGHWPVRIRSVPEGTIVPTRNVLLDIENTDPRFPWVTSFLETALLRAIWYPTTVATRSAYLRGIIGDYLDATADPGAREGLDFKLNDFGSRGVSSLESSEIGGLAHLALFKGTDNLVAIRAARDYYDEPMAGFSIPAAEHSTMTSWGGEAGEIDAMRNMVKQFGAPGKLVACVSDSYSIWRAVSDYWGDKLLTDVRASGATIVVRPDSGDPVTTPGEVIKMLMSKVGSHKNAKGYQMLPRYYRVIQGDEVDPDSIPKILANLADQGLSTDNIAFGMGGAMLQKMDRDTMKFAMKCSAIKVDGAWRDVFKDPVTDKGKASKRGRLDLVANGDQISTQSAGASECWEDKRVRLLEPVFESGRLLRDVRLSEVRERAQAARISTSA